MFDPYFYFCHVKTDNMYVAIVQRMHRSAAEYGKGIFFGLGYEVNGTGENRFRACMPGYNGQCSHSRAVTRLFLDRCFVRWDYRQPLVFQLNTSVIDNNKDLFKDINDLELRQAGRNDFLSGNGKFGDFLKYYLG